MAEPETRETPAALRQRRRAYQHLRAALAEGRERVPARWLVHEDPDLKSLRDAKDDEWQLLLQRYSDDSTKALRGNPERPWGSPSVRLQWWLASAFVAALLGPGLAILLEDGWPVLVTFVVWALAVPQVWRATREQRVARESERLVGERVSREPPLPSSPPT